ncbi:OLC1v1000523C1 [Oldenlandia corymbosa var. corymbosa]|uniref:OLC1v1000523C1 n=1 Tax=Oldenlandia corymbosa var. corymbosa TaxID=529605 RepID=A0AAV1D6L1_OLDCO|nr:OLC1v1000523C1 [Oldenlandia corymbosa var. corymbosa]
MLNARALIPIVFIGFLAIFSQLIVCATTPSAAATNVTVSPSPSPSILIGTSLGGTLSPDGDLPLNGRKMLSCQPRCLPLCFCRNKEPNHDHPQNVANISSQVSTSAATPEAAGFEVSSLSGGSGDGVLTGKEQTRNGRKMLACWPWCLPFCYCKKPQPTQNVTDTAPIPH